MIFLLKSTLYQGENKKLQNFMLQFRILYRILQEFKIYKLFYQTKEI